MRLPRRVLATAGLVLAAGVAAPGGDPGLPTRHGFAGTALQEAPGPGAVDRMPVQGRVTVEPDVLISRDNDRPHVEPVIAVKPGSMRHLLAGAISYARPQGGTMCRGYRSEDGGARWSVIDFPEQVAYGGADPIVGYSPAGTAFFVCLAYLPDEVGRTRAAAVINRSVDGGATWRLAYSTPSSEDAPVLAFDFTTGPFAGRAYLATLGGPDNAVRVYRSRDDGRTWTGPVIAAMPPEGRGYGAMPPAVLHDGTVVVPFIDFATRGIAENAASVSHLHIVLSSDGGVTFGAPVRGPGVREPMELGDPRYRLSRSRVQFVADPRPDGPFHALWTGAAGGVLRIMSSNSFDRGRSWSPPRPVDPAAPAHALQYQPHVAINARGVLGVAWSDTRAARDGSLFQEYFAASMDRGRTFTAPVAVSSVAGAAEGSGNLTPQPVTFNGMAGERRMAFTSALARWPHGGDYLDMAVDGAGRFRPIWADARSGAFQLYTARIAVDTGLAAAAAAPADSAVEVTPDIEFVLDPGSFDNKSGEAVLRVRLRNRSARPIGGPLVVEIRGFGSGRGSDHREFAPEVLNAVNGVRGAGARFEYDKALGSDRVLAPGESSGALAWRLRVPNPRRVPDLHLHVLSRGAERGTPR